MLEAYVKHYKLKNVEIDTFEGTTISYAKSKKADFLLRGVAQQPRFSNGIGAGLGEQGHRRADRNRLHILSPRPGSRQLQHCPGTGHVGENIERYVHPDIVPVIRQVLGPKQ